MIGEVSIGGIFVPAIVLVLLVALPLSGAIAFLLNLAGGYRLLLYRPLADVALFILVLFGLVWLSSQWGNP